MSKGDAAPASTEVVVRHRRREEPNMSTFVVLTRLSAGVALALALTGCSEPTPPREARSQAMPKEPREENKDHVRKLYEACLNQGDVALIDELVSPDYVGAQGEKGPAGFRGTVASLRSAFPDIHYTLDELVADGDRVAVHWTWQGTHEGTIRGFAPTHRRVTNTGMAIYQLEAGKIVKTRLETDRLGFLQQIGAIPEDAQAGAQGRKGQ